MTMRARNAAERDARVGKVMRLRLRRGLSVELITRALDAEAKESFGPDAKGPSKRTVIRDMKRGFDMMRSDQPTLQDLKTELDGQLSEMLASWLPLALAGADSRAGKMVLEILDRQAALHGLNAPERIDLTSRTIEPDLADRDSGFEEAAPVTDYDPDDKEEE